MAKIGLIGGTFDPIHNGHIALAKQALSEFGLERIVFIPNHFPWMKGDRNITATQDRVDMVMAANQEYPSFEISFIEIDAGGNSYTCNTVKQMKNEHPEHDYYFIMGADSLFSIKQWYHPEIIFQTVTVLAAVRNDCDNTRLLEKKEELEKMFRADIRLMHMHKIEISSTYIRENFYRAEDVKSMLPEKVYQIIKDRQLYQD